MSSLHAPHLLQGAGCSFERSCCIGQCIHQIRATFFQRVEPMGSFRGQ